MARRVIPHKLLAPGVTRRHGARGDLDRDLDRRWDRRGLEAGTLRLGLEGVAAAFLFVPGGVIADECLTPGVACGHGAGGGVGGVGELGGGGDVGWGGDVDWSRELGGELGGRACVFETRALGLALEGIAATFLFVARGVVPHELLTPGVAG